jgi:hypothetical protein
VRVSFKLGKSTVKSFITSESWCAYLTTYNEVDWVPERTLKGTMIVEDMLITLVIMQSKLT